VSERAHCIHRLVCKHFVCQHLRCTLEPLQSYSLETDLQRFLHIRLPLLHASITILVNTLICARIDYDRPDAVDIGLSSTNASKLQALLNDAARLIGASKSSPISLLSSETPFTVWLPIRQRIQFKICSLVRNYCLTISDTLGLHQVVSSIPSLSSLRLGPLGCPSEANLYSSN